MKTKKDKTQSRQRLIAKLSHIDLARERFEHHPIYPGLEYAKLRKAQYKLVHIVNNFYFRIYVKNTKVELCKGAIHPDQIITISEWVWHCKSRAEATEKIKDQLALLMAEGYTWEKKLVEAQDIHDTAEFQRILGTRSKIDFDAGIEKYQHFEKSINIPEYK